MAKITLIKNLSLFIISLIIAIISAQICSEVIFFIKHKGWYSKLGLHVRQRERLCVKKDKDLISGYGQYSLHKRPDNDSALREYVEVINFVKQPHIYRILCIGGSTTRGVGLSFEQSYPALLQEKLNIDFPGKFEVFNLGLHDGKTTDFIERYFKASPDANFGWKDLSADLVILAPVWNDSRDAVGDAETKIFANLTWERLLRWTKEHLSSRFALGYFIYLALEKMRERVRSRFYLCDEDYFMKRLNAEMIPLRKRIMQNLVLWKKRKAKVYLLAFPGLIEADYSDGLIAELLEKNYGHSKFIFFNHRRYPVIQEAERKLFSSIANDYEIKYFDFTSLMKGLPAYEKVKPRYFVDAIHTGPVINEAIAQGLKESILEELE